MALIVCPKCQLEYDTSDSSCLYCGNPTPQIQKLKGKFIAILIIAALLVPIGFLFLERIERSQYSDEFENSVEPATTSTTSSLSTQQNSTPDTNTPVVLNSTSALSQYVARTNTLLEPLSRAEQLPPNILYNDLNQTYTHAIHSQATLEIKTSAENQEILSVQINNTNTRKNETLINKITIAALRGMLPNSIKLQEIQTQLDDLHQEASNKRNCTSASPLKGYYLFERYNRSRHTSIVGVSRQKPDDICKP